MLNTFTSVIKVLLFCRLAGYTTINKRKYTYSCTHKRAHTTHAHTGAHKVRTHRRTQSTHTQAHTTHAHTGAHNARTHRCTHHGTSTHQAQQSDLNFSWWCLQVIFCFYRRGILHTALIILSSALVTACLVLKRFHEFMLCNLIVVFVAWDI